MKECASTIIVNSTSGNKNRSNRDKTGYNRLQKIRGRKEKGREIDLEGNPGCVVV